MKPVTAYEPVYPLDTLGFSIIEHQLFVPGRGMNGDLPSTSTAERGLATRNYVNFVQTTGCSALSDVIFMGNRSKHANANSDTRTEARALADTANLPEGLVNVVLEEDSTTTLENFIHAKKYLKPGLETRVLAHADHMPRVKYLAELVFGKPVVSVYAERFGANRAGVANYLKEVIARRKEKWLLQDVTPGDISALKTKAGDWQSMLPPVFSSLLRLTSKQYR